MTRHVRWGGPLIASAIVLAGCSHSPPTRTLTIGFVPPSGPAKAGARAVQVRVASVRLPASLDRIEVVSPSSTAELTVDDFAHWGAPVESLAREALTLDLAARLEAGAYADHGVSAALELRLDVQSFTIQGGRAVMYANWVASSPHASAPAAAHSVLLSVPIKGGGSLGTALALADLIAMTADDVAAVLGRHV